MKKLVLVLGVLSLAAMLLPVPTTAQDRGTRVRFELDVPPPPPTTLHAPAAAPVYVLPGPTAPAYFGSGCVGRTGGGCQGQGRVMYMPAAGGCAGRSGGCVGSYGCYGAGCHGGGMSYGAPRGDGTFATPSGRPSAPGVLPWNGPIVGSWRAAAGYDRHYRP